MTYPSYETHALLTLAFIVISTLSFCTPTQPGGPDPVTVVIQTGLGSIEAEIETGRAPITAKNFLRYVDAGHYDGGWFHRTVRMDNQPASKIKIEVVQAGVDPNKEPAGFTPIQLERTNQTQLHHENSTLSMARDGADTATSDFFICIGPQPSLDFGGQRNPDGQGFAAFGRVVKGMDVVKKIQASNSEEQKLIPPIKILGIRRKS